MGEDFFSMKIGGLAMKTAALNSLLTIWNTEFVRQSWPFRNTVGFEHENEGVEMGPTSVRREQCGRILNKINTGTCPP